MPAISTPARRQLDEEEHGKSRQAPTGPHVDCEEVRGGEDAPVSLQELRPGRLLQTLGRGFQAVFAENVGDGAASDLMMEVGHGSLDPSVTLPS